MKPSDLRDLFKMECQKIEELIEETYHGYQANCLPVYDGIIDIEDYFTNPGLKILWILKEPHEGARDGELAGGGWHCRDVFDEKNPSYDTAPSTWHPIIYTTYGILNDFLAYENMPYIRENRQMAEIIKKIAFINVKKTIGYTRTNNSALKKAYADHKVLLHQQIITYNPDIIIGAGTMDLFYEELGIQKDTKNGSINYVVKNDKLFIWSYHPAQTQVTRNIFVNDIIALVESWHKKQL
ncbi:MAG: hypothetical protein V4722_08405 [Bacteroidota bacterium]